jgi:hypothetical protein
MWVDLEADASALSSLSKHLLDVASGHWAASRRGEDVCEGIGLLAL